MTKAKDRPKPVLSDYAQVRMDTIRSTDLDFQKHVNNVAFVALCSNARFEFNAQNVRTRLPKDAKLFLAHFEIDYLAELVYGPPVHTGSRILALGRSSYRLEHAVFQDGRCAARAVSVMVYSGGPDGGAQPWPEDLRAALAPAADHHD